LEKQYFSCADTAKFVRKALKKHFPETTFSVRSKTYSGGASIDVSWTNGAAETEVSSVVKQFQGAGFDGMNDYKFYVSHFVFEDGTVTSGNSEGSGCNYPRVENEKPEGAVEVHFGADFIFCHREITDEVAVQVAEGFNEYNGNKFSGDLFADVDPEETYRTLGRWWDCVWKFVRDKDLTDFQGVVPTDCSCGQWPMDFFKLKED